eukprot:COSAG05_NODE_11258_length_522_cov_1.224586_1_plen_107_part_10
MAAFKAANPGCRFSDFVRWFSPNDWRPSEPEPEPEPEGRKDDEEQQQCSSLLPPPAAEHRVSMMALRNGTPKRGTVELAHAPEASSHAIATTKCMRKPYGGHRQALT